MLYSIQVWVNTWPPLTACSQMGLSAFTLVTWLIYLYVIINYWGLRRDRFLPTESSFQVSHAALRYLRAWWHRNQPRSSDITTRPRRQAVANARFMYRLQLPSEGKGALMSWPRPSRKLPPVPTTVPPQELSRTHARSPSFLPWRPILPVLIKDTFAVSLVEGSKLTSRYVSLWWFQRTSLCLPWNPILVVV